MKQEETRKVLMDWTEKELKDRGITIFMRKYWIGFLAAIVLAFSAFYFCMKVPNLLLSNALIGCIFALVGLGYWLMQVLVGDKYWEKLKDKEQPIELERLPSIWWLFNKNRGR